MLKEIMHYSDRSNTNIFENHENLICLLCAVFLATKVYFDETMSDEKAKFLNLAYMKATNFTDLLGCEFAFTSSKLSVDFFFIRKSHRAK